MLAFIFDTETTGLIDNMTIPLDKQPSIIEFFGQRVDLETGSLLGELEVMIKPPNPVSDEITRITGIDNIMLADKPPFKDVAASIWEMIEYAAPTVIAHNLSFDREMLELEAKRLDYAITWPRTLCSVEASVHLLGYRLSLTNLHLHLFNQTFPEAHRARHDVQALTRCMIELFKRGEL